MTLVIHEFKKLNIINYKKYKHIFGYKRVLDKLKIPNDTKLTYLPEDYLKQGSFRLSEHKASEISKKIIRNLISDKKGAYLDKVFSNNYSNLLLSKALIHSISRLYFSFILAERVRSDYEIKGQIDLVPRHSFLDLEKNIIRDFFPKDIRIPKMILLRMRFLSFVKRFYFFSKSLFYPEYIFFKTGKKTETNKEFIKYCCIISDGQTISQNERRNDFFVDGKLIKYEDILFVIDLPNQKKVSEELRKSNYRSIDFFTDLIKNISRKAYLKNFYKDFFLKRIYFLISLLTNSNFVDREMFEALRSYTLWNLFHYNFSAKSVIRQMISGDITSSFINSKYSKNIFIYMSVTEQFIEKKAQTNITECLDYSHMKFDFLLSNKLSINWMKEQENEIHKFIDVGVIYSDYIRLAKENKNNIKSSLGIDLDRVVINFADSSILKDGVGIMSTSEYFTFLETLLMFSRKRPDLLIIFTSKHFRGKNIESYPKKIRNLLNEIILETNIVFPHEISVSNFQGIGISDIVISYDKSSLLYEALAAEIKTIVLDFSKKTMVKNFRKIYNWPTIVATSNTELENLFEYWLKSNSSNFNKFLNNNFRLDIDEYSDGKSIPRVRNFLKSLK